MFEIAAEIAEDGDGEAAAVGCFDPTKVVVRLMAAFPEAVAS